MEKPPFEDDPLDEKTADEERDEARGYTSQQWYDELEALETKMAECTDAEEAIQLGKRFKQIMDKYQEHQKKWVLRMAQKRKEP